MRVPASPLGTRWPPMRGRQILTSILWIPARRSPARVARTSVRLWLVSFLPPPLISLAVGKSFDGLAARTRVPLFTLDLFDGRSFETFLLAAIASSSS